MRGLPARSGNGPALPPAAATDRLALSNNARLPSRAKEPLPVDSLVPLRSAVAGPAHFLPLERLVTAVCGAPEAQVGHIMLSACAASAKSPGGGHAVATRRCRAPAGRAVYQPATSPVHGSIPSSDSDTSGDDNSDSHHPSHAAD